MKNYFKEGSRSEWYSNQALTTQQIQIGCLQRIADALDGGNNIIQKLKNSEESQKYWRDEFYRLQRSNIALKGVITRLKKIK